MGQNPQEIPSTHIRHSQQYIEPANFLWADKTPLPQMKKKMTYESAGV